MHISHLLLTMSIRSSLATFDCLPNPNVLVSHSSPFSLISEIAPSIGLSPGPISTWATWAYTWTQAIDPCWGKSSNKRMWPTMERCCDTPWYLKELLWPLNRSWIHCPIFLAPGQPICWCQGALPSLSNLLHTLHFLALSSSVPSVCFSLFSPHLPNSTLNFAFHSNYNLYPSSFLNQTSWTSDPYSLLPILYFPVPALPSTLLFC